MADIQTQAGDVVVKEAPIADKIDMGSRLGAAEERPSTTDGMQVVFSRPKSFLPVVTNYCPGCAHGVVQRLVAEAIDEAGVAGNTVGVVPVGCSVLSYDFFGFDTIEASHGRAPAVATGVKRVLPGHVVFAYQGDGDLASIGTAETVHAATRGENITVIFINNAIYGMTGGQMAPTSIPGQVTQTSPYGRDALTVGFPVRVCELLSSLDGVAYLERVSVDTPQHIRAAKAAIKRAFQNQIDGVGYSLVEVVAACPTNWKMSAHDAEAWLRENMLTYYPLGVYKDVVADGFANAAEAAFARAADCPMVTRARDVYSGIASRQALYTEQNGKQSPRDSVCHEELAVPSALDTSTPATPAISEIKAIFAGFGGQGVLFAGRVLANAGLLAGKQLSWFPSYGPEMRGGTANCSVTLSSKPIGSPQITRPNVLVALNQPGCDKFAPQVPPGGIIIADSGMVSRVDAADGVQVLMVDAAALSEREGLGGFGNIVLLGKMWSATHFCSLDVLNAAIEMSVPASRTQLIDRNKQALMLGISQ